MRSPRLRPPWLLLALATALGGCRTAPKDKDRKEVFVEPFVSAQDELRDLPQPVAFPLPPAEQPRAYSSVRSFEGENERVERTRRLIAETRDAASDELDAKHPGDPKKIDNPPSTLILPDRPDARDLSAVYLGHCAFRERRWHNMNGIVHHVTLLVVNRERFRVSVPVSSFTLQAGGGSHEDLRPLPIVAAATDRGVKIVDSIDVPRGEQRRAHLFFAEPVQVSPLLSASWRATVEEPAPAGGPGGVTREVLFRCELVRRYVCIDAPLSPLEDRVARGNVDLAEPGNNRNDWVDPGLSAVPGLGR